MPDNTLFPVGTPVPKPPPPPGAPRVQVPVRNQVELLHATLDSQVEDDHPVRVIWDFVEHVDVTALYEPIRAVEGGAGRPPIDPRILLALWLYATVRGISSGRELEQLCSESLPFRWLCGGVSVNHHTLTDFRSKSGAILDDIMTDSLTVLLQQKLVTLKCVAHDGMRTRAHAGSSSFHGSESLEECYDQAEAQVQALRREFEDDDPGAGGRRSRAARERAARERKERIAEARRQMPGVEAVKKKKGSKTKPRVSTTDPDARVMKMANGGYNPAYNVQLSADVDSQIIVGVGVTNCGSDHALLPAAIQEIEARCGRAPENALVDGGFNKPENIAAVSDRTTVYAPPTEFKDKDGNVKEPKPSEVPAIKAWHERMKTDEAKEIYKDRASTIECVNAHMRNRNLRQFNVRGLARVKAVVLLYAIAHNAMRAASLRKAQSG